MSDMHTKPTGTRRSHEICGLGYRDIADRVVGQDRNLASDVLHLGSGLDDRDAELQRLLAAVQAALNGAASPAPNAPSLGSASLIGTAAADLLAAAAERDDLLQRFEAVLAKAHQALRSGEQQSGRPVIRFN